MSKPECPDGAALIPLTGKHWAVIDEADCASISSHTWTLARRGVNIYAVRNICEGGRMRSIYMHGQILGKKEGHQIDHINGNGLDNRRSNLRFCTPQENVANQRRRVDNKSGFKGVVVESKRFRAILKNRTLGYFETAEEAARVYDAHALEEYGAFAKLNFPQTTSRLQGGQAI